MLKLLVVKVFALMSASMVSATDTVEPVIVLPDRATLPFPVKPMIEDSKTASLTSEFVLTETFNRWPPLIVLAAFFKLNEVPSNVPPVTMIVPCSRTEPSQLSIESEIEPPEMLAPLSVSSTFSPILMPLMVRGPPRLRLRWR